MSPFGLLENNSIKEKTLMSSIANKNVEIKFIKTPLLKLLVRNIPY